MDALKDEIIDSAVYEIADLQTELATLKLAYKELEDTLGILLINLYEELK